MNHKVVLLEDDMLFQLRMEEMLHNSNFVITSTFSSTQGLYEYLETSDPCILICDLVIQGKPKGLELIQRMDLPHVAIVAITALTDVDVFRKIVKRSIPFIVKPFHRFTLLSTLQNVSSMLDFYYENLKTLDQFLFLSNKTKDKEKVWKKDIIFLETQGNYLTYHCLDGRKFVEKTSMRIFLTKQMQEDFIQIHKNFAINVKHISKVDGNKVVLGQAISLPLSKTYRRLLINHLKTI